MLRVLLAGGGTAGHVNPALAVAEIIKERYPDAQFLFAGTPNGLEARLIPQAGYDFAPINVAGFQRKISLKNIKRNAVALKYLALSGKRAKEIIKDFKPNLVVGTGGYVSGPIVRKAAQMGIKTVIHEQNAFPGVTTKILAKHADRVMLTVEKAKEYLDPKAKTVVTGLPVRSGFSSKAITKEQARKILGLDDNICILSTGGSLGAGRLNETVSDLIAWYKKTGREINHIHSYGQNGRGTFVPSLKAKGIDPENDKRLRVSEYIDNMPVCMAAADLIISRCGANALAEIEAVGRGAILIPSPIVAENHQYYNGMVLQNAGAGIVIEQKNLTSEKLIQTVSEIIDDKDKLEAFSKNSASLFIKDTNERIASVIFELIQK